MGIFNDHETYSETKTTYQPEQYAIIRCTTCLGRGKIDGLTVCDICKKCDGVGVVKKRLLDIRDA